MIRKSILINEKDHALLKQYCKERGLKMSFVISDLISRYCKPTTEKNILKSEKVGTILHS